MSTIKCKFCEAENETDNERCFSCNAPLPKRSNIDGKDKENLNNYIQSVENMLNTAKKKDETKIIFAFFILTALWISLSILLYKLLVNDRIFAIIIDIIMGFVFFIIFGLFIGHIENKAIEKEYNRKIKNDILEYLKEMHYEKIDFKTVASEVLKKDSHLYKFLDDF